MAGLSLGSFAATAAQPPSQAGASTIAQTAYGTAPGVSPGANGPKTAFYGVTLAGAVGAFVLIYLWVKIGRAHV